MAYVHTPVLLKEVVECLGPRSGGVYFDGTAGGGGYAEAILKKSAPDGRIICVDIDEEAVRASRIRLAKFGERAVVVRASYVEIVEIAGKFAPSPTPSPLGGEGRGEGFDGMVLDLGLSSSQLTEAGRGFSFLNDGPLDMRMDLRREVTAADIINKYSEEGLRDIFRAYGEEKFAGRMARAIAKRRGEREIKTTAVLAEICRRASPLRHGRIHPATRVFQALRIAVNGELDNLKIFLERAPQFLRAGGRLVIVSYHSLEDRLVKRSFKHLAAGGDYSLLTKKPITPGDAEVLNNPRARSAKLRTVVRQ